MKRIGICAAIAFGCATTLAAQRRDQTSQPGRPGGESDETRPSQSSQAGTITLTGCLQRADGSSCSSSGAAGSAAQPGAASGAWSVLTDASPGSSG